VTGMARYDEALVALHRAPHADFVAERKRLAAELAATDKASAALLTKRTRPSISAWAVNQLYFQERDDFDALLSTAARVRRGNLDATAEHRKVTNKLVAAAGRILESAGHAASEATLRRVSATLSALAAAGGFEPDLPGTLTADRDPPGFEAVGIESLPDRPKPDGEAKSKASASEVREARAAAAVEKRRAAEAAERARVERRRLEGLLRTAKAEVEKLTRERDERKQELDAAEAKLDRATEAVKEFETRLENAANGAREAAD
jgi:hypothetical protein